MGRCCSDTHTHCARQCPVLDHYDMSRIGKEQDTRLRCPSCNRAFVGISGLNTHLASSLSCRQQQHLKAVAAAQQRNLIPTAASATVPTAPAPAPLQETLHLFSDPEDCDDEVQGDVAQSNGPEFIDSPDDAFAGNEPASQGQQGASRIVSDPLHGANASLEEVGLPSVGHAPPILRDKRPDLSYLVTSQAALEVTNLLLTLKTKQRPLLLKHIDAKAKDLPFGTIQEFNDWLLPEKDWKKELIHSEYGVDFYVWCRKNDDVLYDLFEMEGARFPVFSETLVGPSGHKMRAVTCLEDADWLPRMQKLIRDSRGPNSDVIPYFIYSDGSQTITIGKGFQFHRVIVYMGSRGKYGYRTIGWLPVIIPGDLPISAAVVQSTKWTELKRTVLEKAVDKILEPLKAASFAGRDYGGIRGYLLPVAWVGDLVELYALLGLKGQRANYPSASHLVHKRKLGDVDGVFPERTATQAHEVLSKATGFLDQGRVGKCQRLLIRNGLKHPPMRAPLDGFAWTDYMKLFQPDRMHTDGKGLLDDMLRDVKKSMEESSEGKQQLDDVEHYMDNSWQPGARPALLPRGGLYALDRKITARETVLLAKVVIVFLSLTHLGAAKAIAAYLTFMALRDAAVHTTADLAKLEETRKRSQRLILQNFTRTLSTPKLFGMRCFVPAICELGNVEMVGTEFGERSHKDVKAAVPFTNGHREDILRQVIQQVDRSHAAGVRSLAVNASGHVVKPRGLLQRAVAEKSAVAPVKSTIIALGDLGRAGAPNVAASYTRPELQRLPDCLAACLTSEAEEGVVLRSQDLADRLFKGQVRVYNRMGISAPKHRGNPEQGVSIYADAKRNRFTNIAVSGEGDEEWLAQARLFLGVRMVGSSSYVPYALVRWYEATGERRPESDMVCMRWGQGSAEYDVIPTSSIRRPVTIQAYPREPSGNEGMDLDLDLVEDLHVYNHFL